MLNFIFKNVPDSHAAKLSHRIDYRHSVCIYNLWLSEGVSEDINQYCKEYWSQGV